MPLYGKRELLVDFPRNPNLEACCPIHAFNAAFVHDNHPFGSSWTTTGVVVLVPGRAPAEARLILERRRKRIGDAVDSTVTYRLLRKWCKGIPTPIVETLFARRNNEVAHRACSSQHAHFR